MNRNVLVAMSGGVDSSLAAKLLADEGWHCSGGFMKLLPDANGSDAQQVAERLGLPFFTFEFQEVFEREVIRPFCLDYERGVTPNPCVRCNRTVKFGVLLHQAHALGFDWVATGHYARVEETNGRFLLKKAVDGKKDQTYFLACLTQEQLAHVKFPLGELHKTKVRALAEQSGLQTAHKKDSQDICFVSGGDYGAFLEAYTGCSYPPGDFLDLSGSVVGQHRGAVRYTLGQRKGLHLAMGTPVYVCAKNMAANTVTVGPPEALYTTSLVAEGWSWFPFDKLDAPLRVTAKTRHSQLEQPAIVRPLEDGKALVEFDTPQRAVTPGQAVVLYDGELVVGGGTICLQETNQEPGG